MGRFCGVEEDDGAPSDQRVSCGAHREPSSVLGMSLSSTSMNSSNLRNHLILQVRKTRHRERKQLAQGHTANRFGAGLQSQASEPGNLGLGPRAQSLRPLPAVQGEEQRELGPPLCMSARPWESGVTPNWGSSLSVSPCE